MTAATLQLPSSAADVTQTATPAPTGFDNKTNGFEAQARFNQDRAKFDETEFVFENLQIGHDGGLGPVYNHTSCVACHQNAGFVLTPVMQTKTGSDALSGTSSQVSEIRAGHNEQGFFRDAPGGSVI